MRRKGVRVVEVPGVAERMKPELPVTGVTGVLARSGVEALGVTPVCNDDVVGVPGRVNG